VPEEGPAIIVANHSGTIPYDAAMIHLAVYNGMPGRRIVRFLVEDFAFSLPIVRGAIERMGGVRACHEHAARLLEEGWLVLVFPEGVRGAAKPFEERYRLGRFGRGGFVRLALRQGVPVVPSAVVGAEEIHPIIWKSRALGRPLGLPFVPFTPTFPWLGPLGLLPLPTRWRISFGRPFRFGRKGPRAAEDDALVEREAERVRASIQSTIDRMLAARRSVW